MQIIDITLTESCWIQQHIAYWWTICITCVYIQFIEQCTHLIGLSKFLSSLGWAFRFSFCMQQLLQSFC